MASDWRPCDWPWGPFRLHFGNGPPSEERPSGADEVVPHALLQKSGTVGVCGRIGFQQAEMDLPPSHGGRPVIRKNDTCHEGLEIGGDFGIALEIQAQDGRLRRSVQRVKRRGQRVHDERATGQCRPRPELLHLAVAEPVETTRPNSMN